MEQLSFFEVENEFHGLKIVNSDVTIDADGSGYYKGSYIGYFRIKTPENGGYYSYGWHTNNQGECGPTRDIKELQIMFDSVVETAVREFKRKKTDRSPAKSVAK